MNDKIFYAFSHYARFYLVVICPFMLERIMKEQIKAKYNCR